MAIKQETILTLGLLALGGYALWTIRKPIEATAGGISEAVGGVGSGLGTIGREAGDIVVDVGSAFEPLAAGFQGTADTLRSAFNIFEQGLKREANQSATIDTEIFNRAKEGIIETGTEKDLNKAKQSTLRSRYIQDFFTGGTKFYTQTLPNAPSNIISTLGANVQKQSAALVNTAVATATIINAASASLGGGKSSSLRSSSVLDRAPSTPQMSLAIPMSIAPAAPSVKNPSLREKVATTISAGVEKAKGLITSITSRLRK